MTHLVFGCCLLDNHYDSVFRIIDRHPSFCPIKKELGEVTLHNAVVDLKENGAWVRKYETIPKISCDNCKFLVCFSYYGFTDGSLVMHHKDNNPKNMNRDNLTTLCKSCNGKRDYRKKRVTPEEVKT
jgi:hypothetical protein